MSYLDYNKTATKCNLNVHLHHKVLAKWFSSYVDKSHGSERNIFENINMQVPAGIVRIWESIFGRCDARTNLSTRSTGHITIDQQQVDTQYRYLFADNILKLKDEDISPPFISEIAKAQLNTQ